MPVIINVFNREAQLARIFNSTTINRSAIRINVTQCFNLLLLIALVLVRSVLVQAYHFKHE